MLRYSRCESLSKLGAKIMKKLILLAIYFSYGSIAFGASDLLVISDIDDTLKVSGSGHFSQTISRLNKTKAQFKGMKTLLWGLNNVGYTISYVTAAKELISGRYHRNFLSDFPKGNLYFKSFFESTERYKISRIIREIEAHNPKKVILLGDNHSKDAKAYNYIANTYGHIEFAIFIRMVHPNKESFPNEISYLTAAEIAIHLADREFIGAWGYDFAHREIENILKASRRVHAFNESQYFPNFLDCSEYEWSLEKERYEDLREKLVEICNP